MTDQAGLLPGTLDLLILKAVSLGKLHGYGVLLRIEQISGGALQIQQGALYPALYRLEHQGLIASEWGTSENNRQGQVLSPDGGGAAPARRGDGELEPARRGDRAVARGDAAGGLMIAGLVARVRSLWRGLRRRSDVEAEMDEEFRLHLELRAEDLVRSGLSPAEAARRARLEFGSVGALQATKGGRPAGCAASTSSASPGWTSSSASACSSSTRA